MGMRPEYELYNVTVVPYCLSNVAGDIFDRYPFDVPTKANVYEDLVSGRMPEPWKNSNWVKRSDYPRTPGSL